MPGWHARTKKLVAEDKLQVYGIAPEQYPDRMALFLQWKELDFPVLVDPLNTLNVKAVPITLLVDQSGVIRYRNPRPAQLKTFLETDYPETKKADQPATLHPLTKTMAKAILSNSLQADEQAFSVIERKKKQLKDSPALSFQAGVLARRLYDRNQEPELFQTAVDYWEAALQEVPSQYIWRRRIQQYGPRLDKPYPFYNWVEQARKEITARGETPVTLTTEPSGSEVAQPLRQQAKKPSLKYPDPKHSLPNSDTFLSIATTLIPHTDKKNQHRVHLKLSPKGSSHWSSDAQEAQLWLLPEKGEPIFLSAQASPLQATGDVSSESRTLEADLTLASKKGTKLVLFYSLCSDEDAVCRYLKTEWPMKK